MSRTGRRCVKRGNTERNDLTQNCIGPAIKQSSKLEKLGPTISMITPIVHPLQPRSTAEKNKLAGGLLEYLKVH